MKVVRMMVAGLAMACGMGLHAELPEWKAKDTAWEATYLTLHVVDWIQTLWIAHSADMVTKTIGPGLTTTQRRGDLEESNPILGPEPSVRKVNTYFITAGILHVVTARLLSPGPRRIF